MTDGENGHHKRGWAGRHWDGICAAVGTGGCIFWFSETQDAKIFHPKMDGLEEIKSPSEYKELKAFDVTERTLTIPGEHGHAAHIVLWEKKAKEGKPHYLLFHGNTGHWGDTGPLFDGATPELRRGRLRFLNSIARTGAGFTAVSLSGFGKSDGQPGKTEFDRDITAVVDDLLKQNIPPQQIAVAGESLGSWAATRAAAEMTQRGAPPALLGLENPFTSMADLGARHIQESKIARAMHVHLSADDVEKSILKHPFHTDALVKQLSPATRLLIVTSGRDQIIPPEFSDKLTETARTQGLTVTHKVVEGALHQTVDPRYLAVKLARTMRRLSEPGADPADRLAPEDFRRKQGLRLTSDNGHIL